MRTTINALPARALNGLAANHDEVIRVYSHPFTYWSGETTTEYIMIVRDKDGRLMLLSCTDVVPALEVVLNPDDRRVYFPANELEKLVKRAEMLTETTNEPEPTTNQNNTMKANNNTEFNNAIATEIEEGVMRYEFSNEAETEKAVLYCIANGIKFNTTGRCSLVVYRPTETAPTHRVNTTDKSGNEISSPAWGLEMAEAIAADRRASFPDDVTEIVATETTECTTDEETHAARCLHIYLNNTAEIYHLYTEFAIASAVANRKLFPQSDLKEYLSGQIDVEGALQAAARLVKRYDNLTPTPQDIERVKADYIAYIVECAKESAA